MSISIHSMPLGVAQLSLESLDELVQVPNLALE